MEHSHFSLQVERLLKFDDVRQRFEAAWRAGAQPLLDRFLEEVEPADRIILFVDLLGVELELRRDRGEGVSAAEYHRRFPQYAPHIDSVFHEAADEARARPLGLRPGSVLGDFRIEREIGRGGMGVVYEAEQVPLGRRVAVKILTPIGQSLDNPRARFVREARAAAGLHHTNIVPVLEVGEQEGILFYAMQLIQGRPLDRVLAELRQRKPDASGGSQAEAVLSEARATDFNQGERDTSSQLGGESAGGNDDEYARRVQPQWWADKADLVAELGGSPEGGGPPGVPAAFRPDAAWLRRRDHESWRYVSRIGRQVAEALQYAHERGILHRDVKPANLLVDAQDNVWVTDFGLAKVDNADLTHRNDVVGTLRYLAPEVLEGRSDARSDVYSLGLTLYELLSLRHAFPAREHSELIRQVSAAEIVPLSEVAPYVPRDLATIVGKATRRDPRDRYQTAQQLADDLDRFLRDQPILARRHSAAELLVRLVRRNRTIAGLCGVLALLLCCTAIGATVIAIHFRRLESRQQQIADEREWQRQAAVANAAMARNAERRVVSSLVDLQRDQGLDYMEDGDYLRALLCTARALGLLEGLSSAAPATRALPNALSLEESLRFRIAALLDILPPVVARRTFDDYDWLQAVMDEHAQSLTANTPQLEFVAGGELSLVSLIGDVALRWYPEADTVRRMSGSPPPAAEATSIETGSLSAVQVRFTRDGRRAARYSATGGLALWSCEPATLIRRLESVPPGPRSLLGCWLSPDERRLLVCFAVPVATVELLTWDMETGQRLQVPPLRCQSAPSTFRLGVQMSRDGRRAVLNSQETIAFDVETGAPLIAAAQPISPVSVLEPSGRFLLNAKEGRIQVRDLDLSADAPPAEEILLPADTWITSLCGADSGRWTVAGTLAGDLYILDMADRGMARSPIRHNDAPIELLAMSPLANAVAVSDAEGLVQVWSVPAGLPLSPPLRYEEPVTSLAWRDDGRRLAAATQGGDVTIWDLSPRAEEVASGSTAGTLTPSPSGQQVLALNSRSGLTVWDLTSHPPQVTATLPLAGVKAATWHPDGTRIALVSQPSDATACEIHLWNPGSAQAERLPLDERYRVMPGDNVLGFMDDGHKLAMRSGSGPVVIDLDCRTEILQFEPWGPNVWVSMSCAVSNQWLAACERIKAPSDENLLRVWEPGGELVWQSPLPAGRRVQSLTISPNGSLLVAAGEFGVRLWRCCDGHPMPLQGLGNVPSVTHVCFDPTSTRLALIDGNSLCRVAQVGNSCACGPPFPIRGNGRQSRFSPDGKRLVVVTNWHGLSVWDWLRGEPLTPAYGSASSLREAMFSPDGSTLAVRHGHGELGWLSVPLASSTPWPEVERQLHRATGRTLSENGQVRRVTAAQWRSLGPSAPPSHGE